MLSSSLSGIRVLDFTRLFPGPLCTLMLGDLGAEVTKIEAPEGELARYIPPYQFGSGAAFLQLNRGKRSLTLNLRKETSGEIVHRLLKNTDVLVESFRPGVMRRFKLDYEALKESHPSLIYCSISGFGQTGPDSRKPGHDLNYISMAGILSLNGDTKRGLLIPPVQMADTLGAFQATAAILAALVQRTRTGNGQYLDVSLLDGALFLMLTLAGLHPNDGSSLPLSGKLASYNVYRTADQRYLAVALLEPKFWQTFCLKMKLDRYFDLQLQENQEELISLLSQRFASKTLAEWLEFFRAEDLCITAVNTYEEAMNDGQIHGRGMLLDVRYPSGVLQQFKTPFVSHIDSPRHAPLLGQHNVEILTELGYTPEQIEDLRKQEVL